MRKVEYSEQKRVFLLKERFIDLEEVKRMIEDNRIIDTIENKNHPHQKIFVIFYKGYYCGVPFVEDEEKIFIKTAYLSRKLKKIYSLKK